MKKISIYIILIVFLFCPITVDAASYMDDALHIAEEYNVDTRLFTDFSLEYIAGYIKDIVVQKAETPLKLTAKICGIIFICAAYAALENENSKKGISDIVCVLTVFMSILNPLQNILVMVTDNLVSVKNFMITLLPVFAGTAAASGEVMTSAVYSGIFLSGILTIAEICIKIIVPSTKIYFALTVSDCVSPYIKFKSISDFYIRSVRWAMKSLVSIICFLLTVQTAVAQGSDTLAIKTGRALTGTAVPVIGSVLRDAFGSVMAGMEAIKGFAGAIGITGILTVFLPSVVSLSVYRLCFNLMHIICEMFSMNTLGKCIKSFSDVTELMLSVVFLFITMLVFSIAVIIAMTNGV